MIFSKISKQIELMRTFSNRWMRRNQRYWFPYKILYKWDQMHRQITNKVLMFRQILKSCRNTFFQFKNQYPFTTESRKTNPHPFPSLMNQRFLQQELKEFDSQDEFANMKNDFKVIPVYLKALEKRFDERLFSITLVQIANYMNERGHQVIPQDTLALIHHAQTFLYKIFIENLNNITKLNTLTNGIRRLSEIGIIFPEDQRIELATKIYQFLKDKYTYTDQGCIFGYAIRLFSKFGFKNEKILKDFMDLFAQNMKRFNFHYLFGAIYGLSRTPVMMVPSVVRSIAKEIEFRRPSIHFDQMGKIIDTIWSVLAYQKGINGSAEFKDPVNDVIKTMILVLSEMNNRPIPFDIADYANFLFLVAKTIMLMRQTEKDVNFKDLLVALEVFWEKEKRIFIKNAKKINLDHMKRISEAIDFFNKNPSPNYFPKEIIPIFIESLIKTFDVWSSELVLMEHISPLLTFLEKNSKIIEENKINTTVSIPTYDKFALLAFSEPERLKYLTKGSK